MQLGVRGQVISFPVTIDWWKIERRVGKIVMGPLLGTFQAFVLLETKRMTNSIVKAIRDPLWAAS